MHYERMNAMPSWGIPSKSRQAPPITLVLDLDETLVHCTVDTIDDADLIFPVVFGGTEYKVHVRLRPYLDEFLRLVAQQFEVVVFTASQKVYANALLNRIDPKGQYIRHRMYRESCLPVEGNYLKDLNVLGPSRKLSQMVLVDNSPHAFGYQVDNGIPIESWYDDPHDRELLKLEEFLRTLHGSPDVRPLVRSKFQSYNLIDNS
jgi:CTD small phosphatase-like protein 2